MLLKAVLLGSPLHITKLGHSGPQVLYADPKEIFTGDFTSSSLCQDDKKERKKQIKLLTSTPGLFSLKISYCTILTLLTDTEIMDLETTYETKGCINKALQKCRIQLLNSTTPIMNQRPR